MEKSSSKHALSWSSWVVALVLLSWAVEVATFICRLIYSGGGASRRREGNGTGTASEWSLANVERRLGPYALGGSVWDLLALSTLRMLVACSACGFVLIASIQPSGGRLHAALRSCVQLPPLDEDDMDAAVVAAVTSVAARRSCRWISFCCGAEWIASGSAILTIGFTLIKCLARLIVGGGYSRGATCSSLYYWIIVGIDIVACALLADAFPRALAAARELAEDELIAADDAAWLSRSQHGDGTSGEGSESLRASLLLNAVVIDDAAAAAESREGEKARTRKRKRKGASASDTQGKDALETEGGVKPIATKRSLALLLRFATRDWPLLLIAFSALVVAAIGQAVIPHLTGKVIDCVVLADVDVDAFERNTLYLALVALGCSIFTALRGSVFTVTMARLNVRIRRELYHRLLSQEIGFFDVVKTGDITSRLAADTTKMSDQISLNLNVLLRSLVQGITVLGFMLSKSVTLSLVTLISIPSVVYLSKKFGGFYQQLAKETQAELAKGNAVADEAISSMATVRVFAGERVEATAYDDALARYYTVNLKQALVYTAYAVSFTLFPNIVTALVLFYGGKLVIAGNLSGGALVAFMLYQQSLSSAFNTVGDVWQGISQAVGAANQVFALMDRVPKKKKDEGRTSSTALSGRIELRSVSLRYPARPEIEVLSSFSLVIEPGETVALVGASGGGKSSVIKLILNLYEPSAGRVLLDGIDVHEFDPVWLSRQLSVVGQEPVLFARTVRENIAYGVLVEGDFEESSASGGALAGNGKTMPSAVQATLLGMRSWAATREERVAREKSRLAAESDVPKSADERADSVRDAAVRANADGFISELPKAYRCEVGEKGSTLSGGQKQRVAIARALWRSPSILLLDEATSALDAESERIVQDALDDAMSSKQRTVVVVAHRLSTVQNADRIVVIAKGAVIESGTHVELLARPASAYKRLVAQQLQKAAEEEDGSDGGSSGATK